MGRLRELDRSLWVLLSGILVFHAGWYMLLPYLAVLFTTRRGLSPAQAGLVLGAQSVSLLVGSLLGGALSDWFGRKSTLIAGLVLRTGGIAALGVAAGVPGLLGAAAVTGLGGGFYSPAAKAGITELAPQQSRNTAFALRSIAASLGTSTGPALGAALVDRPLWLFGAAAALHGTLAAATAWLLSRAAGEAKERPLPGWEALTDLPYVTFSVAATLAWMLFSQLSLAVPLFASQVLGLEEGTGLLWTFSSLAVVLLQAVVSRQVLSRLHPLTAMAAGTGVLGTGLGLMAFARGFGDLLVAVLVFVVGEMFLMPTADTAVSLLAPPKAVGSYFGIASFAWGTGEAVGNVLGGILMERALSSGQVGLPWVLYFAVGLGIGGFCLGLRRWRALDQRLAAATVSSR